MEAVSGKDSARHGGLPQMRRESMRESGAPVSGHAGRKRKRHEREGQEPARRDAWFRQADEHASATDQKHAGGRPDVCERDCARVWRIGDDDSSDQSREDVEGDLKTG